jgi:hypothetical protein
MQKPCHGFVPRLVGSAWHADHARRTFFLPPRSIWFIDLCQTPNAGWHATSLQANAVPYRRSALLWFVDHDRRPITPARTRGTATSGPRGTLPGNDQSGSPQPNQKPRQAHPGGAFLRSRRSGRSLRSSPAAGFVLANPRRFRNGLHSRARSLKLSAKLIQIITRHYFI